jgi:outer membrane biosynthesis protein TonB
MGRQAPEKNSGRRTSPFGFLGAILLAVWMFVLGVWVGQGGLAWLIEPEPKPISLARLLGGGQPPPAPPPAPSRPSPSPPSAPSPPAAVKPGPGPTPSPAPRPPTPSPAKPGPPPPPASPPTPPTTSPPLPPPSRVERPQAVVVASVTSLEAARRLAARWRKLGVAVLWVRSEVSGRVRYRVRTVKTYSFAEARKAMEQLRKLGRKIGSTPPWIIGVDR